MFLKIILLIILVIIPVVGMLYLFLSEIGKAGESVAENIYQYRYGVKIKKRKNKKKKKDKIRYEW